MIVVSACVACHQSKTMLTAKLTFSHENISLLRPVMNKAKGHQNHERNTFDLFNGSTPVRITNA